MLLRSKKAMTVFWEVIIFVVLIAILAYVIINYTIPFFQRTQNQTITPMTTCIGVMGDKGSCVARGAECEGEKLAGMGCSGDEPFCCFGKTGSGSQETVKKDWTLQENAISMQKVSVKFVDAGSENYMQIGCLPSEKGAPCIYAIILNKDRATAVGSSGCKWDGWYDEEHKTSGGGYAFFKCDSSALVSGDTYTASCRIDLGKEFTSGECVSKSPAAQDQTFTFS